MLHLKKYNSFLILLFFIATLSKFSFSRDLHELVIETENNRVDFFVELAKNALERKSGLMFRKKLPEKQGMLLIFPKETNAGIWMKNTYIPLDIIFISREKIIRKIVYGKPEDETILFSNYPTKYVLEINAGLSKKFNIKEGNKIYFEKFKE